MTNPYKTDALYQLSREELEDMTPEQIEDARKKGHLADLIAYKPDPLSGLSLEKLKFAAQTGTVKQLREQLRNENKETDK